MIPKIKKKNGNMKTLITVINFMNRAQRYKHACIITENDYYTNYCLIKKCQTKINITGNLSALSIFL